MRNFRILWVALICLSGFGIVWAENDYSREQWVPGHLLVKFTKDVGTLQDRDGQNSEVKLSIPSVDALLQKYHVASMRRVVDDKLLSMLKVIPDMYRNMVLECPSETDILAMMAEFARDSHVEYAEPDLLRPVLEHIPNDVYWSTQWDKRLMGCPTAWDFSTGSNDIYAVAVDGGTYWPHADLYDNLWVNPEEDINGNGLPYTNFDYPGDIYDVNEIDDDGNGKVDDLIGWDFLRGVTGCDPREDCDNSEDNDPISLAGDHGTHVIGLIGAVGNNNIGVTGVNWKIKVMSSRAGYTPDGGTGLVVSSCASACMIWAVGKGATIVNMSYGSTSQSPTERDAVAACWASGAILCGASGNDNHTFPLTPRYPAGYADVVAVGSVDTNNVVSNFSNIGPWVDLYSPGNMVRSLTFNNGYADYPGTSMASPNAAGVFALLWSIFPSKSNAELVDFVFQNCYDITSMNTDITPEWLGHGRIDATLPLKSVFPYVTMESFVLYGDNDDDGRLEPGETANLTITLHNNASWQPGENLDVTITTTDPGLSISNNVFTIEDIAPGQSLETAFAPVNINALSSHPGSRMATFEVAVTGPNNLRLQYSFLLRVGRPDILLVEDDGLDNFHDYYARSLTVDSTGGWDFDTYNVAASGDVTWELIHEYQILVWVCGNQTTNTLTVGDQTLLAQFLSVPGAQNRLMLAGQYINADISGTPFYANYLHSANGTGMGTATLRGETGDPISSGTRLLLRGPACAGNSVAPTKIVPVGGATGFYAYTPDSATVTYGAVRFQNETYRTAYFAFALEAACGQASTVHHKTVIRKTVDWFGPRDIENPPVSPLVPTGYVLHPSYPNPFNPTTTVHFDLPRMAPVTLRVYDIQGRQVQTLMDRTLSAGSHSVMFDGTNLASGAYLVRMQSGDFSSTQRMMLVK